MWTKNALFALLGTPARQTYEAVSGGGVRRLTYYWSCGGKADASKAQKRAIGDGFKLDVQCEHPRHRELGEYASIHVSNAFITDGSGDEVDAVAHNADGYTLLFTLAGPPDLGDPLAVRLYCGRDGDRAPTVRNLEPYNGSEREYSYAMDGRAERERRIDVVMWPVGLEVPEGVSSGLRVAQWNVPVS